MSALIGDVKGPNHNSPNNVADVWCSSGRVELRIFDGDSHVIERSFDSISARNFAALLVRASEEADRMATRAAFRARTDDGERE